MSDRIEGGLVYHDCFGCGKEFREDEVSWATEYGKITFSGNPYCDACLPEYDIIKEMDAWADKAEADEIRHSE